MSLLSLAFLTLTALSGSAVGSSASSSLPSANLSPRATCAGNTPTTRDQWCDFSIDTDWYTESPDTGVTREYWWELTDVTVAPDGVSRPGIAINGTFPGPTIVADWGDIVKIHVTNSLTGSQNGTTIHWHGIRQNYTNENDGVASVTQCPTPPGESVTYTWKAEQYGSSWYHSHFGVQAWEGVVGSILINGPTTANYDVDVGTMLLTDWSHNTPDELWMYAESVGPPTMENGLINGTNVYNDTGSRFELAFESGTSYLLRLINGAIDTHFKFSIDNHTMKVIASDFIPVEPYETTVLNIGMGQRYDVIVTADQASVADNFWMRAIPQAACSDNENADNIRGIVTYAGTSATPNTTGWDYMDACDDETANLIPHLPKPVGDVNIDTSETVALTTVDNLFKWTLNSTSLYVDWQNATLFQIVEGVDNFDTEEAVIKLPNADEWIYMVVQTELAVPHPIHLHGHDFFVLAQGTGTYDDSVTLNMNNPPRRDTAMLPAEGYLVMAWQTDNPGVWLMHCHIGWHTLQGFALQFVERYDEIVGITDGDAVTDQCASWTAYQEKHSIIQEDDGI
ncbi:multicopper oxidase [Xylariomycetidae sp. FL0641]|nr:multicopper oxidase [Xylariomycetidae sp. FL0641]